MAGIYCGGLFVVWLIQLVTNATPQGNFLPLLHKTTNDIPFATAINIQSGPKKWGHRLMSITLSNLDRLKKSTGKFLCKFVVKWILKIPPRLAYVVTLPCETVMSAKQAINDKLQCSLATYRRCSGVVNNQIKKGLLLSPSVNCLFSKYLEKTQART